MGEFSKLDSFLSGDSNNRSGASHLPTPLSPAWYKPEERSWFAESDLVRLSKKDKASLVACCLLVQFAPTDRSTCRCCGTKIEKGTLRLGYPSRFRESEPAYSIYLHPECYVPEVFGVKEKELHSKVFGYEALSNTERAHLWKAMRSDAQAAKLSKDAKSLAKEFSTGTVGVRDAIAPVETPQQLVKPLLPFQKEGLAWMCRQEDSPVRGGVLADEMGMGKTIQAISLLLARPLRGPCLIVCPMAAVHQWVTEIQRFTVPGSLRTLVYHGAQKSNLATAFRKVEVVITTYQTLEVDYRREMNKQRLSCKYCGKLFLPEKLAFHQKYFCGPDAIRTAKQQKTNKKHKDAALKGMRTLGIGQQASLSDYQAPTITNIYKDFMKQAGVDVKAKGYWNVMKEARERIQSAASLSSAPSQDNGDSLSRERLAITDRAELQELCSARGLDSSGRKSELIDRLMDFSVRGMTLSRGASPAVSAGKGGKVKPGPKAKAKAKIKAKAKANMALDPKLAKLKPRLKLSLAKPGHSSRYAGVCLHKTSGKWQATHEGKYLGLFPDERKAALAIAQAAAGTASSSTTKPGKAKGEKKMNIPTAPRGSRDSARTVASERAMRGKPSAVAAFAGGKKPLVAAFGRSPSSVGQAKGMKRKRVQEESSGGSEIQTWEGVQLDLSDSPLHSFQWSRIILDEGHRIKGRTNSTAMAAYALPNAGYKWCLTGTPMQNRIGELYSLIRFLRVRPFAFYYCKKQGCACECARFMRERYCPNCGHVRFLHFSHFKSKVSNPIIKFGYMGAGREAFQTLRNDVLNRMMLRRTKEERKADLQLPPMKVVIRKDKLSQEEQDFYSSLYMQSCVQFDTYVRGGTILHNYAHIFDLLTSLRRAVDHPYLIVHGGSSHSHKLPNGERLTPQLADICGLCQDAVTDDGEEVKRVAKCGHAFHDDCIRTYLEDAPKLPSGGVGCPVCFTRLTIDLGESSKDSDEEEGAISSAKRKRAKSASPAAGNTPTTKGSRLTQSLARTAAATMCSTPPKSAQRSGRSTATASAAAAAPRQLGKRHIMQKVKPGDFQSSTKIEALVEEVQKMISGDARAKGLVFSQFGAMLELVEFRLKNAGISCVVFRGGMTMQARNDALVAFNTDPSLKVILISLKAGGEGLNLQIANHVFMLDPWWNPACEMQAIQRAHRIGQTREVRAVRFITTDTIEERIIKLQEKKQLVFDACIDASQGSMQKLNEQDLRFLFQH